MDVSYNNGSGVVIRNTKSGTPLAGYDYGLGLLPQGPLHPGGWQSLNDKRKG